MGAELSGCCAVEKAADKAVISEEKTEAPLQPEVHGAPQPPAPPPKKEEPPQRVPTPEEVAAFQERLLKGMEVVVLLADGTGLTCQLKLSLEDQYALSIAADKNLRVIPFNELKAILYGKDQLKRVETKANLVDDPNCVALHMVTGNCIPLRFDELPDKDCFVAMMRKLKAAASEKAK
eukprot:GHVN01081311.1.p2 GENE.GHVN01081311.1~~GHVN01081311.1.p2  ORF type:complete len:178 (+),score=43.93 GHVN01081311.1:146-679(+)